jgi:drug/metabolite transporter (DMT)-like permease
VIGDRTIKGILFAVVGFFLLSVGGVIAKGLRQVPLASSQISFFYALEATALFLLFSRKLGGLGSTLRTGKRKLHLLRGLLAAPTPVFNFYAFSHLPLSNAYAVIFLAPILTAILAIPVLKERATRLHWILIFAGFAGVLMAMRPGTFGLGLPVLAVLWTAVFVAVRNVTVAKMGPQETPLSLALYPSVAIALFTLVPAWKAPTSPDRSALAALAAGGVAFGLGLLLTSLSFRYAATAVAAPFHYTQIVWGVLAGLLFFRTVPDAWTLLGCATIVVSGVILVRLRNAMPPPAASVLTPGETADRIGPHSA